MADEDKKRFSLLQLAYPIFCFVAVFLLYQIQKSEIYRLLVIDFPVLAYLIPWGVLLLVGILAINLYEKYQEELSLYNHERSDHEIDIISILNELLYEKAPTLEFHADRTAHLARAVCDALNLPQSESRIVVFAAMFHDIGKILMEQKPIVPEALEAGAPAMRRGWSEYNAYPIMSQRILDKVLAYSGANIIVRHQHDRWNGKGVPGSLTGANIPLGSRIIHLVCTYDSWVNGLDEPRAQTHQEAMAQIDALKGVQFDPALVELFHKLMAERAAAA